MNFTGALSVLKKQANFPLFLDVTTIFSLLNRKKLVRIFLPFIAGSFSVIQVNPSLAATLVNWDTIGWQDTVLNQELQSSNNTIKIDFTLGSEAQLVNFGGAMTPSVSGILNGSNPDSGENIDQSLPKKCGLKPLLLRG
ncbi:MAG: hypothetical protein F6K22_02720 [Okeania sp. SIO2F4]|uniref:hypothetical protein n=1 Tax=Okeania sp. SIO2F4 TaxID=2607790 RepID=UPI001429E45E|nr:hypothetical protein [Okeania sp. SIO2F4]NES01835.1 hypothetical protein [Okeania sp. SIO2F4]